MRPLLPHQQIGFDRLKHSDTVAFLMEMRLGKTLLAIRWARYRGAKRVLVVAPSTPLGSWMNELEQEQVPYEVIRGNAEQRTEAVKTTGWHLITYEAVWRTPAILCQQWDAVILDESTAIKNIRAKVTKFVLKHLTRARCRAILTGEIQPQSMLEVWTQMAFVCGGQFMGFKNFWKWRDTVTYTAGYERLIKTAWKPKIKEAVHTAGYVLTRKQAGLGNVKVREIRRREIDSQARSIYRQAVKEWAIPGIETKHAVVVATWLRRIVGGHCPTHTLPCWKYDEVVSLITGELVREQVVVWFAFNRELARVWQALKKAGVEATWVAGEVGMDERRRRAGLFQEGKRRVMLAQIKCARMGVDLSAADTEIYFSNSWSFEDRKQSEDRIEHPNKKATLLVIDLVTEGTVDEDVVETMKERRADTAWFVSKVMQTRRMP